jgi:phenylpyruvate tautomerase
MNRGGGRCGRHRRAPFKEEVTMPLLKIETSATPDEETREALVGGLSKIVAKDVGKPEKYVMVSLVSGAMSMSGQAGDAAFVDVRSIGGLGPEVNKRLARDVCDLLGSSLGLRGDRVYMNFTDVPAADWGWDGSTFG